MGVDPPQSAFERHWAQRPLARHLGADAGQSLGAAHSTHAPVVALQIARGLAQSVFALHATQAPVAVSQSFVSPAQLVPAVHEPSHLCVPGQHEGAEAPQSALVRHASHSPRMQNFDDPPLWASEVQSTQPSAASHDLPVPQVAAPQTPDPDPPLSTAPLLPPHEAASVTMARPQDCRARARFISTSSVREGLCRTAHRARRAPRRFLALGRRRAWYA
jgi:hypothetical protein